MIFTGCWEVLVLNFSEMENTAFFQLKSWWKDDIYLLFLSFPWYSRTWEIWFFVLWILWYPGASFGSRTPPIFGCQTRKLSATNQQWSLWQYTKHLLDMFPRFWIKWSSSFGKYSIFHPWQGFSANTFTSRNAILFIFWILKGHRFLDMWAKFLV